MGDFGVYWEQTGLKLLDSEIRVFRVQKSIRLQSFF